MSLSSPGASIRPTVLITVAALASGCFRYVPVTLDAGARERVAHRRTRITTGGLTVELDNSSLEYPYLWGTVRTARGEGRAEFPRDARIALEVQSTDRLQRSLRLDVREFDGRATAGAITGATLGPAALAGIILGIVALSFRSSWSGLHP